MAEYCCARCGVGFESEEPRCPRCLRGSEVRLARPAAAPARRTAAETHLLANAIVQAAFVALHLLTLASVLINLSMMVSGSLAGTPLAELHRGAETGPEQAGQYGAYGVIGIWAFLGIFWTPVNAWGLWKRRPWARISTIVYWSGSFLTCCCIPFGVYGLVSLLRRDVADLFRRGGA